MDELQPSGRALLERAREAVEPSPEALAELGARLGFEPSPPPPSAANTPPGAAWLKWVLAAALVVGLGGVGVATRADEPASTLTPAGFELPSVMPPEPTDDRAEPVAVEASPEPAPAAEEPVATRRTPRRARTAPARQGLGAELELIVKARKALAAGQNRKAQRLAREYRSRFSGGTFAEEAQVLDLVASCHLGRDATSISRAQRYLGNRDAAFARRVEAACLDPE